MVSFHLGGKYKNRRYNDDERGDNSLHAMYTHTKTIANSEIYNLNELLRFGLSANTFSTLFQK